VVWLRKRTRIPHIAEDSAQIRHVSEPQVQRSGEARTRHAAGE